METHGPPLNGPGKKSDMNNERLLVLRTSQDTLKFNPNTGQLVSFRCQAAPEQEFIAPDDKHPVFAVQYIDVHRHARWLESHGAPSVHVAADEQGSQSRLTITYRGIGGLELDLTASVRAWSDQPLSRWTFSLRNDAGLEIVDVQFPFVVAPYKLGGADGAETVVLPSGFGSLIKEPLPAKLTADSVCNWQFSSQNGSFGHYPGGDFAQFLAYYNDRAGLYIACEDTEGGIKRLRAMHRDPGLRLGIAHVGDWPRTGARELGYDVVLGSFVGDWYEAAGMYRDWSLRQKWATPLHKRQDVPTWLLDSPPQIVIRPQGVLDGGPVEPIEQFLPYEKCIPLLERIAQRVKAPLVAIIMGWERGGSWVYPDCFPPIGGEESVREFARLCRERNWHVGSFCNGTRWVVGHCWNRYDGWDYYHRNGGPESICRQADGSAWNESWDFAWRPSICCCLGAPRTRQIAEDFVRRLIGWGLESIQFFDQNCGAATFPCFAADHEHPPVPGRWMTRKMEEMMGAFRRVAGQAGENQVIHSVEMCDNEYCLPLFQQSDSRLCPPGYTGPFGETHPIFQFLFHECIVIHGAMGPAPEPYHLPIRNAYNGVMGQIPGGVLTGDGTLLNKDTYNWAPWDPQVGSDDDALEMIRTVTALRRGPGRDFLVFGRMQKPCRLEDVRTMKWAHDGRRHAIPAVFCGCWTAPDGRFGVALANWTTKRQRVTVSDGGLGSSVRIHLSARRLSTRCIGLSGGKLTIQLPALSCAMLVRADTAS